MTMFGGSGVAVGSGAGAADGVGAGFAAANAGLGGAESAIAPMRAEAAKPAIRNRFNMSYLDRTE